MSARSILHVDMDAFYASIEQRDDAALRGRPVVVGGRERGVVAAASYEARRYGIRSAMPMAEALRRCPDLVRIAPRMSHYQSVSRQIFTIFGDITPLVEGLSLDEAFLDVTDSRSLLGSSETIARTVKARILQATELTASVGVAENKLVAKIASDLDKPDGLVVITARTCRERLDPLPVSVIPGVGRKTLARLEAMQIRTIQDLRTAPDAVLEPVFGRFTPRMRARAAGLDDRPVLTGRAEKSISAETTFARDLEDVRDMERELLRLTERTARRLQRQGLAAGTVFLKIREADFTTCTRQAALHPPDDATAHIHHAARRLLGTWVLDHPGTRIRLLGVGVSGLAHNRQGDLFAAERSQGPQHIDEAMNRIRDRFGEASVSRARTLPGPGRRDE